MEQWLDWKIVLLSKVMPKSTRLIILILIYPITKLTFIKLFLSIAATYNWHLHQLDIKNVFLYGDL